jgi:prophage maintenance system killer protein
MRFLTLIEVLKVHRRVIEQTGGAFGIRDVGLLESAIAQPRMTFGGEELYSSLLAKAVALEFSIIFAVGVWLETDGVTNLVKKFPITDKAAGFF